MSKVRVELPQHLRTLAGVGGREVTLELDSVVSIRSVLDTLEMRYPMLEGTIRDHGTRERRAFLRFFACEEDWSHEPVEKALPESVASGREPLLIIGAIAGGNFAFGATRRWRHAPLAPRESGFGGHSRWSWN